MIVTHPVKYYFVEYWSKEELNETISKKLRNQAIKSLLKQMITMGRATLKCYITSRNEIFESEYKHYYCSAETIYIGRTAIKKKGIRHNLRKSLKGEKWTTDLIPIN